VLRVEDEEGRVGIGEASPLPDFGTEDLSTCERALCESLEGLLESEPMALEESPDAWALAAIGASTRSAPNARAAIECAFADLAARAGGLSLSAHWRDRAGLSGPPAREVSVQALIGGETPDEIAAQVARVRERGHRAYKLKLVVSPANSSLEADLSRVAALREAVGASARIRLDANEAWTRDEAMTALRALEDFGVDYVEQPVARHDLDALAWLDEHAPIPVAADEALLGEGLDRCLERRAARILILKPAAIGGFEIARRCVERARSLGLRIVWSSLIDGAISRQAALHLAAALEPNREDCAVADAEVHGLGTGILLDEDFVAEPPMQNGSIAVSSSAGLGLFAESGAGDVFEADGADWLGAQHSFGALSK
jgi:o-succinylbenzoate synthase